jgi:hypothetical protein
VRVFRRGDIEASLAVTKEVLRQERRREQESVFLSVDTGAIAFWQDILKKNAWWEWELNDGKQTGNCI